MRAPGNGHPDSAWPLRRKPVNHRLAVPGALGLGSSSNLTLCSPSFKFFFLSFPLTPPFPPKLLPKSRLSPLNILNPLLSVSLFCIQGGAVRSWRQPRPLALGAELAEDLGIFSTCLPWTATAPWASRDQPGSRSSGSRTRASREVCQRNRDFSFSLSPSPIHAILIYIASSPLISQRDGPLSRIWTPFKTEKMGRGGGQSREPGSTAPTHKERESCSY